MSFSSGRNLQNNINTTEAQTLSNKTLDNTTVIQSGADIQTPAIIDPSRSDVKKDTLANLQTYASTASNGQLCYATDSKKMFQVLDGALSDVGGGASGINYITNPDAEVNADGWNNYANTTPGVLPDDFLGSVSGSWSTIAASASSPLRGSKSFIFGGINGGANDLQGHGVYSSFTVDSADLAKKLTISFDYLIDDSALTNAVDGMLRVYIYDEDKSELIRVNGEDLQLNANSGTHYAQFQTDSVSTNYRLVIHQALALNVAEDYTIRMDNVQVGPTVIAKGTIVTDWEEFTPTGTWSNVTYTGYMKRVGDSIKCQVQVEAIGVPTGSTLDIDIPSGLQIDSNKLYSGASNGIVGTCSSLNAGAFLYELGQASAITGTNRIRPQRISPTTGQVLSITPTTPFSFNTSDKVFLEFEVPIQGWSSNAKMSEDFSGREIVATGYGNDGSLIASDATDINFTEVEDTTASFDGTVFTAPESGTYILSGAVRTTATITSILKAFVDGSFNTTLGVGSSVSVTPFSGSVTLEKGQELTVRSSATSTLSNSNLHSIHIQKLASAQTILETETVAARYTSSSGQTLASATYTLIKYEENDGDTHNAYDISTGFYTVPVSGWYDIKQVFHLDAAGNNAGETVRCRLSKNNARIAEELYEIDGTNSSSITHGSVQTIVYANKGDLISCEGYQNTDAGAEPLLANSEYNVFTIYRIK